MKFLGEVNIVQKVCLNDDVFKIVVNRHPDMGDVKAGQFFNIKTNDSGSPMLRRPISVSGIYEDTLEFTIKIVGKGTQQLSNFEVGQTLDLMGPLGNGYEYKGENDVLIIGGGIGIAPVKGLIEALKVTNPSIRIRTILGFRDEPYETDAFNALSESVTVMSETDDRFEKGFVTSPLEGILNQSDNLPEMVYTCGPTAMLKAVTAMCNANQMPIQLLMEEKMACGIGACLVCTCKIKADELNYKHVRMCKEGPMFYGSEVIFDA